MNFYIDNYSEEVLKSYIKNNILSEEDWISICRWQKISEGFIREFQDKFSTLAWNYISELQTLSEDFIREFKGKLNWKIISYYQELSEDFIREFQHKVDWFSISHNLKLQLSDKFCEEFDDILCFDNRWRVNGKFHRTLGPAIINDDGTKEYWYRGKQFKINDDYMFSQFQRWLKLRMFD